jgi:hypothetical protein
MPMVDRQIAGAGRGGLPQEWGQMSDLGCSEFRIVIDNGGFPVDMQLGKPGNSTDGKIFDQSWHLNCL